MEGGVGGDAYQDRVAFPEQGWRLLQPHLYLDQCVEVMSPGANTKDRRSSKLPTPPGALSE